MDELEAPARRDFSWSHNTCKRDTYQNMMSRKAVLESQGRETLRRLCLGIAFGRFRHSLNRHVKLIAIQYLEL